MLRREKKATIAPKQSSDSSTIDNRHYCGANIPTQDLSDPPIGNIDNQYVDCASLIKLDWYNTRKRKVIREGEALYWCKRAAELGDIDAQRNCGRMYDDGANTPVDHVQAFYWYQKAAEQGDGTAQYYCGQICHDGGGTEQDIDTAIMWMKKAAGLGENTASTDTIAYICYEGPLKMLYDGSDMYDAAMALANREFQLREERNSKKKEKRNSKMKENVDETERLFRAGLKAYCRENLLSAEFYFTEAAERGHPSALAQYFCAKNYEFGGSLVDCETADIIAKQDKEKALYWYKKSAEQGYVTAQYACGVMYDNGIGAEADKVEALRWYQKAAEHVRPETYGCPAIPTARFRLASMYYYGEGTEPDKKKALFWNKKAGTREAYHNCAFMYDNGEGTEADKAEALFWHEKAAECGDMSSQLECGKRYLTGEGTDMNKEKAFYWYQKAAEQRLFPGAEKRLLPFFEH